MKIHFNHCVKKIDKKFSNTNWYKFHIFADEKEDVLKTINYVEYQLHWSYVDPKRTVRRDANNNDFHLDIHGVSAFGININIRFYDGTEKKQFYSLKYD